MSAADDIARRALEQIGIPFRLHGRCAGEALDCVGLVAVALGDIAQRCAVPMNYTLRGDFEGVVEHYFKSVGMKTCTAPYADGDIVLVRAAPGQFHLMVRAHQGFVHAHAGLRKIVLTPGASLWPVTRAWRAIC
jgi:murein DD-endopeptidase / murein LD-carboxypeptidase